MLNDDSLLLAQVSRSVSEAQKLLVGCVASWMLCEMSRSSVLQHWAPLADFKTLFSALCGLWQGPILLQPPSSGSSYFSIHHFLMARIPFEEIFGSGFAYPKPSSNGHFLFGTVAPWFTGVPCSLVYVVLDITLLAHFAPL